MESQSVFMDSSIPGTPLHQLSPERMNQQRIPQSPSLHSFLSENQRSSHRDSISSDVQGKIAFLNGLSTHTSPTRAPRGAPSTPTHAAFQRAVLGYEESQATLASVNAEAERLREQLRVLQKREKVVGARIESLMEQLQQEKDSRNSDKIAYVNEVKKCRKQTYQAEMSMLESREEVKETKSELRLAMAEIAHEKAEKEKARQEAFERAYAIAGMTEEMEVLKDKIKAVEKERDAAHSERDTVSLQNKELLSIPTPAVHQPTRKTHPTNHSSKASSKVLLYPGIVNTSAKPREQVLARQTSNTQHAVQTEKNSKILINRFQKEMRLIEKQMDGETLTLEDRFELLKIELKRAKQRNEDHEDMIHFLHMQCQFKACPCRQAEARGERFVHDIEYDNMMQEREMAEKAKLEEDKKFNQLPPDPVVEELVQLADHQIVEEAVQIPLPDPEAMELDSQRSTPDPTAQLEEITQVLVQPGTGAGPFSFSLSTSSNVITRSTTPKTSPPRFSQSQNAVESADADLFNLSPSRPILPRPATSLGVMTLQSPIRLVADSPAEQRSFTPIEDPPFMQSTTTRVALKDSPVRSHRRTQSRPNIRSHSRTRSPLVTVKSNPDFTRSTSESPAPSTVFPVTPIIKHSRSQHNLTHQNHPQTIAATTTTTTTVPLRGLEADDVFSPVAPHTITHANTSQTAIISIHPDRDRDKELIPGTPISREAALAQIRARRDRARSVNLKKENGTGAKSVPGSAKRGLTLRDGQHLLVGEQGLDRERARDVSQASAPGRFGA